MTLGIIAVWDFMCHVKLRVVDVQLSRVTHLVISSFDIFSLERRMVQFWARRLSMTEMILCLLPMVPISLRSSMEPSTD